MGVSILCVDIAHVRDMENKLFSPEEMSVSLIRPGNYDAPKGKDIHTFSVLGGYRYNWGEDEDSKFVFGNVNTLTSVTYWPDCTKGGDLVRPFYWKGDRKTALEFPVLKTLKVTAWASNPRHFGWIAPELETLGILRLERCEHYGFSNACTPYTRADLITDLKEAYPKLKTIQFYSGLPWEPELVEEIVLGK